MHKHTPARALPERWVQRMPGAHPVPLVAREEVQIEVRHEPRARAHAEELPHERDPPQR